MLKNILISGLLCSFLSAESFDTFLQNAIENSPYLKSSTLAVDQAKEQGSMILRYKNPTLELEYSDFKPDIGSFDDGYRVNISQPIRLWGVGDDRDKLANNTIKNADASYARNKAIFVRDISLSYTDYANKKSLVKLGEQELSIAKTIYDISSSRYDAGTISRGLMLQAKIDYEMVQIKNENLMLNTIQSYYNLLNLSGINKEVSFDDDYSFALHVDQDLANNPRLMVLKSQQDKALSQAMLDTNKVEWINIFAEFESEPEQDITRVGINFPLAVFNTKSQEVQIAKLQSNRASLLIDNQKTKLSIEMSRLQKERDSLAVLKSKNQEILTGEEELLKMFQNGYKIANINLLQLQDIKNKVISTKRSLIKIKTALDKNTITQNYNQGQYND
ncbi:MAG: TolC family protein [Sulfurimonas sp.]|nr:TolC family protein [Sulfurimonas sp.]